MKKGHSDRFYQVMLACFILISASRLHAQCNASFTYTLGANGTATFASTSTGTTAATQYNWYLSTTGALNNSSPTCSTTFSVNGLEAVSLNISDPTSTCNSSASHTVNITSLPCSAFTLGINTFSNQTGYVGFSSSVSMYSGYSSFWQFGDGSTSTNTWPSHTYSASGVYTTTLTVVSNSGTCTYSTTTTMTLTGIVPCSLTAAFNYTALANGLVNFESISTGTNSTTVYAWRFDNINGTTATTSTTSHSYPGNGSFPVVFTVYDSSAPGPNHCADSTIQMVTVPTVTCSAVSSFSLQKDPVQALQWFAFPTYPASVTAVEWSWGDGSSSTGFYPSHQYASANVYNICLSVTVSCGASYTICSYTYINRMASSSSQMISVNVVDKNTTALGIASLSKEEHNMTISPNPNTASFNLNLEDIDRNKPVQIMITDLLGQTVYSEEVLNENNSFNKTLHLPGLSSGTYFVKLSVENKSYRQKMIITR